MRVLVVTNMFPDRMHPARGIFVEEQVEAVRKRGGDVDVLVLPVHRSRLHYALGCVRVFLKTLTTNYDIVHAHYGFTGVVCLLRARGKLVTTFHGSDVNIGWQRKVSALAYRFAARSIFVSERLMGKMEGRRGIVIPCGVDLERFRPVERRRARSGLGLPMDAAVAVFPGRRDNYVKNYPLFERTLACLRTIGVQEIELWGWERSKLPAVLSAADVMVMTSHHEGSPMVVKEALACNLPVVSVDVGDVAELIAGIPGCAVCAPDPGELAAAVARSLACDGFSGRERVKSFANDRIAVRLMEVYRELCAV